MERLGIAEVAPSQASLKRLKELALAEVRGNEPLGRDPTLLADIAAVEADLDALEATEYRFLFDPQSNGELGPESSILKINGTLVRQRLTELTMRVAGPFAQTTGTDLPSMDAGDPARAYAPWSTRHYLNHRKISIYGGSNEIQRGIVAKAVLGLVRNIRCNRAISSATTSVCSATASPSCSPIAAGRMRSAARRPRAIRATARTVWRKLAEAGALGAFLPESAGGSGGNGLSLMVAMEAFGKACCPSPYPWTVAAAAPLLAAAGDAGSAALGRIASGEAIATVAFTEPRSRYDLNHVETRAQKRGSGSVLTGKKVAVPYGGGADCVLVSARVSGDTRDPNGIGIFMIDPKAKGVTVKSYLTVDSGRAADIELSNVESAGVIGSPGKAHALLERAADLATLALCAEAVGHMRALLDMTVAYTKTRQQFGVALSTFQALQHRMVDMFAATETAASRVQASLARIAVTRQPRRSERRGDDAHDRRQIRPPRRPGGRAAPRRHGHDGRPHRRPPLQAADHAGPDARRPWQARRPLPPYRGRDSRMTIELTKTVTLEKRGAVALIWSDNPPVNALARSVIKGLYAGIEAIENDPAIKAGIIICRGSTYFAGADITEFGTPEDFPTWPDTDLKIDHCTKPIISAIHTRAFGGGFEIALVSHYRIAEQTAQFAFPEVGLGIIPGAGGTQRFPRIAGFPAALDVIPSARVFGADEALKLGAIDKVVAPGTLEAEAIAFANEIIAKGVKGDALPRARSRTDHLEAARKSPEIFAKAREATAKRYRGFKGRLVSIDAIENALKMPFDEALKTEVKTLRGPRQGARASRALRPLFRRARGPPRARPAEGHADPQGQDRRRHRRWHHGPRHHARLPRPWLSRPPHRGDAGRVRQGARLLPGRGRGAGQEGPHS